MGTKDYCSSYEEALIGMLQSLLAQSKAAKQRFSIDKNVERTIAELREVFGTFFVRTSYLIGHIDGLGSSVEQEAPAFAEAIGGTTWLNTSWKRYCDLLRTLFDKIEGWDGVAEYQPFKDLGEEILRRGGMGFVKLPGGGYYVGFNPTVSL